MMKTVLFKNKMFILLIFLFLFLITCKYYFDSVNQPDLVNHNSTFEVQITVRLEAEDKGGIPYFGIRLPNGWTVKDSISYNGILSGTFFYSAAMSDSMEIVDNSPAGYYWWVSIGDSVDSLLNGNVLFNPQINTDNQSGTFFIDYMLGDNGNGLNTHRRSNNHPISVDAPMTVTVTDTNDSGEGSLRQAISDVSSSGEILFNLTYPATIVLDSQLVVDRGVTIIGPESGQLTISGNNQGRILYINEHLNVNISNLTITGGNVYDVQGGGIYCLCSKLSLEDVSVTNNIAGTGGAIYCNESSLNLKNVSISGNVAQGWLLNGVEPRGGDGGGIYCSSSSLNFSNVTINNNSARNVGGGITFADSSNIVFDSETRSNIYFNNAVLGNDLYNDNNSMINIVLDTFTVFYPSSYYAYPGNFNFDILNSKIINYDADLYVSSDGDNSNIGTSPSEALKTISFAFSRIMADSLNPHTIFIDDGIYSPSTTSEDFPLRIPNYVTLSGTSKENVILDAENQAAVIQIYLNDKSGWGRQRDRQENTIENMTITGGYASGIQCWESTLTLNNVIIIGNDNGVDDFGTPTRLYGGGINCKSSILQLTGVTITNNSAGYNGGGINCGDSYIDLSHVSITDNTAGTDNTEGGTGGGIYDNGVNNIISLKDVTIANNSARKNGGGIQFAGKLIFDSEQRCNIYSNQAGFLGDDLKAGSGTGGRTADSIVAVIVDTFTVLSPTEEHTYPLHRFTFDILHAAVTAINAETNNLPTKFALNQNYPNPFNPSTNIKFALPKPETVKIELYNTLGQNVKTLLNKAMKAGYHEVEFNASNLSSGVYFYRIEAGEFQDVKKMILLR